MKTPYGYALNNPVALADTSAFTTFWLTSGTASNVVPMADNSAAVSPSYTFLTTLDQSLKIFSGQCNRVSNYIYGQLEQVDFSSDDQNEAVADSIASVINLVGEPASCTAVFEANLLRENASMLEPLLLGIGSAHHKETENARVQVLRQFASDPNYRVKRAAVRALGRMSAPAAKAALTDISHQGNNGEIGLLAAACLR